jgi:DNA-binding LacI/PurR family transcriptional regulator
MAVRLRDVAERAGVSARSVSNVINGFRYVSPEMRERVQAAIDELDYRPNLLARSLRSGRTGTIGFLLPEISAPYFGELAHQVVEQAQGLGLNVLIDETGPFSGRELTQLDAMSRSGNVDGVLLSALELNPRQLSELRPGIPVVLLGERTAANSALDHVGIDNVAAARDITRHLIDSGRSRIAAIAEKQHPPGPTSRLRLKGYRAALRAAGLPVDEGLIARVGRYTRDDGAQAMATLLDREDPPDAVFCFNDTMAIGALHELHRRGVRVPADVAVAGFDDIEECRFSIPTLSTVAPDKAELARQALGLLGGRIGGDAGPPRDIAIPFRLALRDSAPPVQG